MLHALHASCRFLVHTPLLRLLHCLVDPHKVIAIVEVWLHLEVERVRHNLRSEEAFLCTVKEVRDLGLGLSDSMVHMYLRFFLHFLSLI
jgi:hypothetical protein